MTPPHELARRLGTVDAVVIGLGSMIGAGVFVAIAPAARAAGSLLLIGLAVAAIVAYCNAAASAQLAARYPTSGGTYFYGRERLGPWWGFTAGWAFVVGKTASCAAMALTFATYAVPGHETVSRAIGAAAVVALTALNYRGITRTAAFSRILVAVTLVALAVIVAAIWAGGASLERVTRPSSPNPGGVAGVLQSAGLLFFAFAGYARIATLGEEVRDPARTIPRAIAASLAITLAVYTAVAVSALAAAGPQALAGTSEP
ncbi:MAG: basic amino acid/polyamine antiporter, family, partial [Pseudonocardiales bacterium]|nr:basic amino acid/polyamine antiporter, family [Pseudonocardiales bacterium]